MKANFGKKCGRVKKVLEGAKFSGQNTLLKVGASPPGTLRRFT
jgi:hypothetical protein